MTLSARGRTFRSRSASHQSSSWWPGSPYRRRPSLPNPPVAYGGPGRPAVCYMTRRLREGRGGLENAAPAPLFKRSQGSRDAQPRRRPVSGTRVSFTGIARRDAKITAPSTPLSSPTLRRFVKHALIAATGANAPDRTQLAAAFDMLCDRLRARLHPMFGTAPVSALFA
jgi:hypothetical protein